MKRRAVSRERESGFALLLVFLMSAVIAINLYMQLPRAGFESQRAKEELLQERGQEYIRGIQLYVAKWRRYPESLDSLEKTNNQRFLRKRYKDPMTGKDEWRAIHINTAGQLTDSIVQTPGATEKKENLNNFVTEMPAIGATGNQPGDAAQNAAMRRRPSDQQGMPMPGATGSVPMDPQLQGAAPNGQPVGFEQVQPGQQPLQPGQQPFQQGMPGQPGQVPFQPGMPGQPGQVPFQPGMPGQPGQLPVQPGMPGQPGQLPVQPEMPGQPFNPNQPQTGQQQQFQPGQQQEPVQPGQPFNSGMPYPVPPPPGVPNPANPGAYPSTPGAQPPQPGGANQGLNMINRILTTPRSATGMSVPGAPGLQIGGGIAGFASTMEAPSIKVYNERQKYNEWEFIYDMKKDKRLVGAAAAGGANPNQQQNPLGANPMNSNNPNPAVPNPMTLSPGQQVPGQQMPGPTPGGGFNQGGGFQQPRR